MRGHGIEVARKSRESHGFLGRPKGAYLSRQQLLRLCTLPPAPAGANLRLPPRRGVRAEVRLGPGAKGDDVVGRVAVRERERERRRATDDLASKVILRAVARADVLVGGAVPRHDAAKVRAHSVDRVVLDAAVLLHDQVVRVALQALHQTAGRVRPLLGPLSALDLVAERVLRLDATAAAAATGRDEEVHEATAKPANRQRRTAKQHKIEAPVVTMAAAEGDFVPDMQRRTIMNLVLLGGAALPVGWLGGGFVY